MKHILIEIDRLAGEELKRANKVYPLFASDHEGWAVFFEECIEAGQELTKVITGIGEGEINKMLACIMVNHAEGAREKAIKIRRYAQYAAAELIQVIAMCDKFVRSQEARMEESNGDRTENH